MESLLFEACDHVRLKNFFCMRVGFTFALELYDKLVMQIISAILFPYVSSTRLLRKSKTMLIRISFKSKMSANVPTTPYVTLFINQVKKSKI